MKATKKDIKKTNEKKKPVKKDRLKELENLVVLMDKKIISLEKDMESMKMTYDRIRTRMGV